MSLLTQLKTTEPTLCAVCWDRAHWIGYTPNWQKSRPLWVCDDKECLEALQQVFHMSEKKYDAYVKGASSEGVNAQGEFMAELGKFDLRDLTEVELQEYGIRFLVAFGRTMRKRILTGEAPF